MKQKRKMLKKKRILLIDALNMYYRAYIVDPTLSSNGDPIGGLVGFLKIMQKLVRETKPDKIIVAWDGDGGSKRRRIINKNYKEGRKPIRLNRPVKNMSESEEYENNIEEIQIRPERQRDLNAVLIEEEEKDLNR